MRERVITHVSTRLRKEAFPLPPSCCLSKQRVSKNNSWCFPEKSPCFWRRTTSFKNRKFFFCKGLYFSNRFSTFAIERHTVLRSPFSRKASLPTPSLRSRHWWYTWCSPFWHGACRQPLSHLVSRTKRGNAQELAVMSVLSFREINGKNYNSLWRQYSTEPGLVIT